MNPASEPKSTPCDFLAATTLRSLLRGIPGARTNQCLALPEASYTRGKSAAGEHLETHVHRSRLLCAGAAERGGYGAGMLGLRDAQGAPGWRTSCCRVASSRQSDTATQPQCLPLSGMPVGYSGTARPRTAAFARLREDQWCSESAGLGVGRAHRWLQHCHEVVKMNKDPPFSLHPPPRCPALGRGKLWLSS